MILSVKLENLEHTLYISFFYKQIIRVIILIKIRLLSNKRYKMVTPVQDTLSVESFHEDEDISGLQLLMSPDPSSSLRDQARTLEE